MSTENVSDANFQGDDEVNSEFEERILNFLSNIARAISYWLAFL